MHPISTHFQEKYPDSFQLINNSYGSFISFTPRDLPQGTVVMTVGLSDFFMNVHPKHEGEERNELYFLLPTYFDIKQPKTSWVFEWLGRLSTYVQEKNTWFGHGHTLPCGKNMDPISENLSQNHLFLSRPMALSKELTSIFLEDKRVYFLSVIPIFPDEMDYKQGKGTLSLVKKFETHGVTELVDEYRKTVLKTKWRFFGK
ncbi:MAG: hypothetical protein RL264_975 [Bacteroidota bacterium]|jgi:hypothetical protein